MPSWTHLAHLRPGKSMSDGLSVLPRQAGLGIRRVLAMGRGGFSSIREERLGSSLGPTAEREV